MENFSEILNYIARTNLFNFVIFLSVIVFLVKKINVSAKLEEVQESVKDEIISSETAKAQSEEQLSSIEDSIAHIEQDINEIIEKSEENARLVGDKILQDAQKAVLVIQENTQKNIENGKILLKNELLKRASLASIEIAKTHLINELSWNQGLHDKLINESIDSIEGVDL